MQLYAQSYTSLKEDATRKSTNELLRMPSHTFSPTFHAARFPQQPSNKKYYNLLTWIYIQSVGPDIAPNLLCAIKSLMMVRENHAKICHLKHCST